MGTNMSLHGEDILIESGKSYYIIDAQYVVKIKEELPNISMANIEEEIRSKVFPYAEAPFAVICPNSGSFLTRIKVTQIKSGNEENISTRSFSTDTGLVLVVEKSNFQIFLNLFDYDMLVEADVELLNSNYWEQLQKKIGKHLCGVIMAPGIKSGFDFVGSGLYEITDIE